MIMVNKLIRSRGLTTDVVIFTIHEDKLKVLLIKRTNEPFKNQRALPGGFLWDEESSKDAALRTLKDKAGVRNVYLEQLYTFDGSGRDPRGRVCTITYLALISYKNIKLEKKESIQNPIFCDVKILPKLAFDHKGIISYAIKRLQAKLEYTNVVYSLLPKQFTFNQLQSTYEAVFGKGLDKRNFRKKFMMLKLIKPTKKVLSGNRQRPARLFEFISRKPIQLKKFF